MAFLKSEHPPLYYGTRCEGVDCGDEGCVPSDIDKNAGIGTSKPGVRVLTAATDPV